MNESNPKAPTECGYIINANGMFCAEKMPCKFHASKAPTGMNPIFKTPKVEENIPLPKETPLKEEYIEIPASAYNVIKELMAALEVTMKQIENEQ